jgi:penicillin-binding protein 1A
MGYTPQLLAGAWVGCDDRYIRFSDNYFGQGAHASLPIWASFMSKVAADPACNLDANASFERPSSMLNDFNIDFISKDSTGLEGIDDIINTEDIKAESDYTIPDAEIVSPVKNNLPVKNIAPNKTTPPIKNNSKDTKSKDTKANKEGAKPKAIFPPKKN